MRAAQRRSTFTTQVPTYTNMDVKDTGGSRLLLTGVGILGNGFSAWLLHRDSKHSLNIRGAFLHIRCLKKPAFTVIMPMNDWSLNLTPELNYSPITNLELRLRGIIPVGGEQTEKLP